MTIFLMALIFLAYALIGLAFLTGSLLPITICLALASVWLWRKSA